MFLRLSAATVTLLSVLARPPVGLRGRRRVADEAGQATAEYALVLLGVAALAILVVTWAKSNPVGDLFDVVFDRLTTRAKTEGS